MEACENIESHAFTQEICLGNQSAIEFCNLWYTYCHCIDDLLDTMEDGRPTLSKEAIIAIFVNSALLYNCAFFVSHRQHLFPLVIMIANIYADSVAWEGTEMNRRNVMADVLRCCGHEMLLMVAMICGGWKHVRNLSPKIREADWIRQHDDNDKPN